MGGLKPEISEGIRMFKPKTLKEAISLARMRDEQLVRQRRLVRPPPQPVRQPSLPSSTHGNMVAPIKRLSWEEMQCRRAQGLCFNCNERFTAGHKCQGAKLLLLEGHGLENEISCEKVMGEPPDQEKSKIHLNQKFLCVPSLGRRHHEQCE